MIKRWTITPMIGNLFLTRKISVNKLRDLENLNARISKIAISKRIPKERMIVDFGEYKKPLVPSLNTNSTKVNKFKKKLTIKIEGLLRNAEIIINQNKDFIVENMATVGVLDGSKAFGGPTRAEIYLTNRCNNNCIACWDRSPLIKVDTEKIRWRNLEMSKKTAIKLIKDLSEMGCKEIFFSGGGEPFMHKDFMDIVRLTKKLGMKCYINTNFTLVNKRILRELVELRVEGLLVSLWAATPETYVKTHPNQTKKTFEKIRENLDYLKKIKKERGSDLPVVSIYNVIMNLNYKEVVKMFDFAMKYANYCFLVPVDVIKGQTDVLLLDKKQKEFIINKEKILVKKVEEMRVKNKHLSDNRVIEEQFSSFIRRLKEGNVKNGEYDKKFVNRVPCYIGWTYIRALPEGEVTTCLKSHFKPIGERHYLDKNSIKVLWFSEKWNQFRRDALTLRKDSEEFKKYNIACTKSCDNYRDNLIMHNRIQKLSYKELIVLHTAAYMLNKGYKIK